MNKLEIDLHTRYEEQNYEVLNQLLKEIWKQFKLLLHFKQKNIQIFEFNKAKAFISKLLMIILLIKQNTHDMMKEMNNNEIEFEDMNEFYMNIEEIEQGIHHIMAINGVLM
jgi:hypothetical protein